jgi:glycosyltransferase involved in cell wall biosynthesis
MSQQNLNKIIWFGDLVNPSGFGRIGNQVCKRLVARGWPVMGVSIPWIGHPLNPLNFPVVGLGGADIWNRFTTIVNAEKPTVVVVCQDFPYAQTAFHGCQIDWSVTKFITVTPIDGTPVHPQWLQMVDLADATMVISRFGVEAMRLAGKGVDLLHPGVDTHEFYPAESREEVVALRGRLGIAPDAFVVGMFAMNQGRKCVSQTVNLFREFARDKPDAVLYLDMDKTSSAGWDIPTLCQQIDPLGEVLRIGERVLFREDAFRVDIIGLRERYLLCDVNSVVSHREGFGLPLIEAMACKIVSMALDWCSGPEVVGGGKGVLVRRLPYMEHGTWGGARDAFPDMADWRAKLDRLYRKPGERQIVAERGYQWASTLKWDTAADQFETVLKRVVSEAGKERADEPKQWHIPAPGLTDDGAEPSAPVGDHPGIQPPAEGVSVPGVAADDQQPGDGGGAGPGRRQPGVQPAGIAAPDGGDPPAEPTEPRLRRKL